MSALTIDFLQFSGTSEIINLSTDEAIDEFLLERGLSSTDPSVIAMLNELHTEEL